MSSTRPSTKGNAPTIDIISHLTTRERLLVAQAVYEYGSNAWPDISHVLSKHPLISRPKGFFSPQACQKIYAYLMGEAGYECSDETQAPRAQLHLKLAQKHYRARVKELRTLILEEEEKFKSLTLQIDDIREGRWDEAIAKELGIHPETDNVRSEEKTVPTGTENAVPSEEMEQEAVPIPDEEPMDVSEEPKSPALNAEETIAEGPQEEVAMPAPQPPSSPQHTLPVEITEKEEESIHEQVSQTSSPVEVVGSALEEIKLSVGPHDGDIKNVQRVTPTETTPPLVSREERTQEELKAIEALEELSRLEPINIASVSVQDSQPNVQMDDFADRNDGSDEYKEAVRDVIPDTIKELSEPSPPNIEPQPPISSTVLTGKRKIADIDVASPDLSRDRKKLRDESVPTDDEAVSGRRRPRPSVDSPAPSTKRFQTVISLLHSQISQHRNGNIFHSPIRESEAPDYHEIVKRPMDLKTIKMRIKDGVIANSDDYQREIYLMFANAMMYNRPKSDIARMAREMLVESESHIRDFRQTEGFMSRGKR